LATPCEETAIASVVGAGDAIHIGHVRQPWVQLSGGWSGDVRIEVSLDGDDWFEIGFGAQPGDVFRVPATCQYMRLRAVSLLGEATAIVRGWQTRDGLQFRQRRPREQSKATESVISTQLYFYDNAEAQDGALTSLADKSGNDRTLTVAGGTASPVAMPRSPRMNLRPVIGFNDGLAQRMWDAASDAATYATQLTATAGGFGFFWKGKLLDSNTVDASLWGNWDDGTSNQNAFNLTYNGTYLIPYLTSKAGGGTVHIGTNTAQSDGRVALLPGDKIAVTGMIHIAAKTWTLKVIRARRDRNDAGPFVINASGSWSTAVDSGAADFGIVLGAFGGHGTSNVSGHHLEVLSVFLLGADSAAEVAELEAAVAARSDYALRVPDYTSNPIVAADFEVDGIHWKKAGATHWATNAIAAEQAMVERLGLNDGREINSAALGDSRLGGHVPTDGTLGVDDPRAQLAAGTFVGFTHVGYGPVDDGSGNDASKFSFARSAYVIRSQGSGGGAQLGHSQRSPHSASIDKFVDALTGTHPLADLWHVLLGVNCLVGVPDVNRLAWEQADELLRLLEFIIEQRQLVDGFTPGIILYLEPITLTTTTGLPQRAIREFNAGVLRVAAALEAAGVEVIVVDLNDGTYHNP
jgi:hypothetical protein